MKWKGALIAALTGLLGCGPTLPQPLAADAARTEPGKVTIIEFIDFQCPFCRQTHVLLTPLLQARQGKYRLVRKQVPLKKHKNALPAALAEICAEQQGKADAMADALVDAAVPDLRREGCELMAQQIGLDLDRYRACVGDPGTAARVRDDDALFDEVGGHGLPLLFIGPQRFAGLKDPDTLERALDEEIARSEKIKR